MSNFCECCGQPLPGSEEKVALFGGKLTITNGLMLWEGGHMRMTPGQSFVCMAIARKHPVPTPKEYIMDFLENCRTLDFKSEDTQIIEVHITRIRRMMAKHKCPFRIETVWGIGRRFMEGPADGKILTSNGYTKWYGSLKTK